MIRANLEDAGLAEETDEKEVNSIASDTFVPTGERVGYGCWGRVDVYQDPAGQKWAIKNFSPNEIAQRQMIERNWTAEDVMRNEAIPLSAAYRHLVPRVIERDRNGKMYVGMPLHKEGDLSKRINYLNLEDSLKIARDVADALGYIHEGKEAGENRRAHGDVKPSNILMKDRRAFLSDFGSSTCISIGGSGSERGPHGDINYRAPECFKEKASPSTRADIWSLGAILYEAITKEGIYDGFNGSYTSDNKNLNKFVRKKLKNVPWKVRGFLKKCLAVEEYERFYSGTEALRGLEKIIENLDTKKVIKNHAKKWSLALGLPMAVTGLLVYGAATYEPQKLEMPKSNIQGMLYPGTISEKEKIEFEVEDINNLPKVEDMGMMFSGLTTNAKLSTDNRIVAYLTKTQAQAQFSRGAIRSPDVYTDSQFKTYMAYTSYDERNRVALNRTPWPVWAKSIEVALNQAKTANGKVDLEDVMTISRVGADLVSQAKRASGSFDYKDYITAKDSKGEYIIPEREQNFINTWLAYYKADID